MLGMFTYVHQQAGYLRSKFLGRWGRWDLFPALASNGHRRLQGLRARCDTDGPDLAWQGLASCSGDWLVPATENCRCIPGIEGIVACVGGIRDRAARWNHGDAAVHLSTTKIQMFTAGAGEKVQRWSRSCNDSRAGGKREETGAPGPGASVGTGFQATLASNDLSLQQ